MLKILKQIWHDPVWSKVIAAVILAALAAIWAAVHFSWWQRLLSSYPIPLWLLVLLIALTLFSFAVLLWKRRQFGEPNIKMIDLAVRRDENKGVTYPLKCWVQLRNDSATCADVRISEYRPGTVTARRFVVDVLQIRLREWLPKDHGVDRLAVLPGQLFQAWIGLDESRFNADQVNNLRGRIGTLVFVVNGTPVSIDL